MFFYEFRANGIQPFIFSTSRLREMVGASALVDRLTTRDIDEVINHLGLKVQPTDFARRAGGAFLLQLKDGDQARRLRDFWSLYVQRRAPGLPFSHALVEADVFQEDTRKALQDGLDYCRNCTVARPASGSPFAERAPRTGLPAVVFYKERLLDHACLAKHQFGGSGGGVEDKLTFDHSAGQIIFPLSFVRHDEHGEDEVTLLADNEADAYLAVIHADGNGLGKVVESMWGEVFGSCEKFPQVPHQFSAGIEKATLNAVQAACNQTVFADLRQSLDGDTKVAPIRILVLGGDDITLVTRGADALNFVTCFLETFEQETQKALKALNLKGAPEKLTACAGIAFIKAKQPFHMAYHLAESLCKTAKIAAKKHAVDDIVPATLAFHRITTAMIDSWDQIVAEELTTFDGQVLSMQPYAANDREDHPLPRLSDLCDLADLLNDVGKGPVRELQKMLYSGESHTHKAQRRWRENLQKAQPQLLARLEDVLSRLTGKTDPERLPLFDHQQRSPIADAIALSAVGGLKGGHT